MASQFLLQIVDRATGDVVQMEPGLALEQELVATIVANLAATRPAVQVAFGPFIEAASTSLAARGVGLFRTTAHVQQDLRDALYEVLLDGPVTPAMRASLATDVAGAVASAFLAIKKKVQP